MEDQTDFLTAILRNLDTMALLKADPTPGNPTCPRDFLKFKKCMYLAYKNYMKHISERSTAFLANFLGKKKKGIK